jgi:hypothetical protein
LEDVLRVAFVVAIICVVAVMEIGLAHFRLVTNAGFGPDWDCTPMPKGEPFCVKRINTPK